ncbi:hypothetical protein CZ765_06970 [Corynebacterium casei]|nr:hypothetical protein CZ765_06970 [Corynebacterium casei]
MQDTTICDDKSHKWFVKSILNIHILDAFTQFKALKQAEEIETA